MEELPLTDPERWEDANFEWDMKSYYFVPLPCLFGKPRKIFETVSRLRAEISSKGYIVPDDGMLLMDVKLFSGKMFIEIRKPEGYDASVMEIERSKVYSKVHHGPLKTISKTGKEFAQRIETTKGLTPTAVYYWDFRHGPDMTGQRADMYVVFARV